MAIEIVMPRLNWSQETGIITRWLKAAGEEVTAGEPLLVVETEKAEVEVEADDSGILLIQLDESCEVPVGTVIGFLLAKGETAPVDVAKKVSQVSTTTPMSPESKIDVESSKKIVATPVARRIAREHGIELSRLKGSAPDGSITQKDVLDYIQQQTHAPVTPFDQEDLFQERASLTEEATAQQPYALANARPLSPIRKATAKRMANSFTTVPHFYLSITVDMTEAKRLRETLASQPSYTALIIRAIAMVLVEHPEINCSYRDGDIVIHPHVNLGVAIATPEGLIAPVIHNADQLGLANIDQRLRELRERAIERRFKANELTGGTFTITNLGMFGIEEFLAIINAPEAAIMAVGAIIDRPYTGEQGLELRPSIKMNLSIDHRALDGADAAKFLTDLKQSLEHPDALIIGEDRNEPNLNEEEESQK